MHPINVAKTKKKGKVAKLKSEDKGLNTEEIRLSTKAVRKLDGVGPVDNRPSTD